MQKRLAMVALKIIEVKTFMEKLFRTTLFDDFEIASIEISTLTDFKISGTLNKAYYSSDELEIMGDKTLIQWSSIKDLIFHIIRGQKPPSHLKLVLSLPNDKLTQFASSYDLNMPIEKINGLFINMKYDPSGLTCTTGSSLKIFTLDKSLDQQWDLSVQKYLNKHQILFEKTT